MANTIKVYPVESDEHRLLETVASELTKRSAAGFTYDVKDVYFDLGQGWMWTTIVVRTPSNESWQVLSPRDHERIIYAQDLRGVINDIKKELYRDSEEKPSLFSHVQCDYTGGGIYVYSALYNGEVWLYGGLDNYFGSYDLPADVIEEYHDCDYEAHVKVPSIPYPSWYDILESIRLNCDASTYAEAEEIINHYNPGPMIWDKCMEADPPTKPGTKENPVSLDPNTTHEGRLSFLADVVEVFEDFLDRRGIVIQNEDKAEDPDASNIYGCDFAELSDNVEEVLIKYGFLKEGV